MAELAGRSLGGEVSKFLPRCLNGQGRRPERLLREIEGVGWCRHAFLNSKIVELIANNGRMRFRGPLEGLENILK